MKLAALGIIVGVIGFVVGEDGLLLTAALWIPGGLLLRAVYGPVRDDEPSPTLKGAYGGRRGPAVLIVIVIGVASVAIGVAPVLFDGDEGWRWIPVAVGVFGAGTQLLAMAMLGVGSGVGALLDSYGNPDHPASIRLDGVRETGLRVNDLPRMELDLTVTPEGRPTYQVVVRKVINFAELGSLRVGETYRGLVDLEKPEAVRIDWHSPAGGFMLGGPSGTPSIDAGDDVAARLARVDELFRSGAISAEEHAVTRRQILGEL